MAKYSDKEVRSRAERRASIAATVSPEFLAANRGEVETRALHLGVARRATAYADTLMDALDAAEARDREATK